MSYQRTVRITEDRGAYAAWPIEQGLEDIQLARELTVAGCLSVLSIKLKCAVRDIETGLIYDAATRRRG